VRPIGRNNRYLAPARNFNCKRLTKENSMTRVWWTPNVVQLETRCNNMHMDNMRVSFTRKSVTFGKHLLPNALLVTPAKNCSMPAQFASFSDPSTVFRPNPISLCPADGQEHEVSRIRLNRPSEARVRAAANSIAAMVQAAMPRNQAIQLMTL
jgi:hypothetical protein